jgi:very-short-patch-repair endonuclease
MLSRAELRFAELWELLYPDIDLHTEYRFTPPRRFRFDFAFLPSKIAIEINGGNWIHGRHTRASNLSNEYEKLNLATLNGWRVFVLSPEMINEDWLARIASCIKN